MRSVEVKVIIMNKMLKLQAAQLLSLLDLFVFRVGVSLLGNLRQSSLVVRTQFSLHGAIIQTKGGV